MNVYYNLHYYNLQLILYLENWDSKIVRINLGEVNHRLKPVYTRLHRYNVAELGLKLRPHVSNGRTRAYFPVAVLKCTACRYSLSNLMNLINNSICKSALNG